MNGRVGQLFTCGVDHCQSGETGSLVVQCGVDHCQSG